MAELPSAMEVAKAALAEPSKLTSSLRMVDLIAAAIERDRAQVREAALEEAAKVWRTYDALLSRTDAQEEDIQEALRAAQDELNASLIGQPSQPDNATPHPQK